MGGRHKDPEYHKKWWEKNKHRYKKTRPHSDPDYKKKYYQENKDRLLCKQKTKRNEDTQYRLFKSIKASSKRRGLEFSVSLEDIIVPELCPILKVPMVQFTEYTPSVDRIDSSLGYVKGNIQVISKKANIMKSNATKEELKNFANWVINIEELRQ